MRSKNKLIYGWGFNDVDYPVTRYITVDGKSKIIWVCPYYQDWKNMIRRCYDFNFQERNPTYRGCRVCEEWRYLSNFIKWVDSQPNKDWMNCSLDKDLINVGNKIYSPETCIYIGKEVNIFVTASNSSRGGLCIGVTLSSNIGKAFVACCANPFTKTNYGYIGAFSTELEAHKAWQAKKHEYALQLAELQDDSRVAKALRERYAPDKDWRNK